MDIEILDEIEIDKKLSKYEYKFRWFIVEFTLIKLVVCGNLNHLIAIFIR